MPALFAAVESSVGEMVGSEVVESEGKDILRF